MLLCKKLKTYFNMWIKKFNGNASKSMNENVNFLFKQDKFYVMDNHLSASWCWLQEIDDVENNNLIHIDRHYDLLKREGNVSLALKENNIDIKNCSFYEYCNFGFKNKWGITKVFTWDTYILNLEVLYPKYFNKTIFSTFDIGCPNPNFIGLELSFKDISNNLEDYVEELKDENWILNIDIDYFFNVINGEMIQVFSDAFVKQFAEKIRSIMDDINVVTFCLSPECCGSWENSLYVMSIFSDILDIDFELIIN